MTKKKKKVGSINIRLKKPTVLTFTELNSWVIWQFPRQVDKGLCGAVCPPDPEEGWYPAVIHLKEKVVQVHGHLDNKFKSPNDAADWVAESLKK
jgi:hypothetical protein